MAASNAKEIQRLNQLSILSKNSASQFAFQPIYELVNPSSSQQTQEDQSRVSIPQNSNVFNQDPTAEMNKFAGEDEHLEMGWEEHIAKPTVKSFNLPKQPAPKFTIIPPKNQKPVIPQGNTGQLQPFVCFCGEGFVDWRLCKRHLLESYHHITKGKTIQKFNDA